MFAKLFGTGKDQVLVMHDTDDEGNPCIEIKAQPEGMGVCTFGISFNDTPEGEVQAQKVFDEMTEDQARMLAQTKIIDLIPDHLKAENHGK